MSPIGSMLVTRYVQKNNTIKVQRKHQFGEVFTPIPLIQCMLDTLPPSAWTNPHGTWLDPCCGAGFFMICIYERLMEGLASWKSNATARSNHIIQHMLYMVDINKANTHQCKKLFGPHANITCADFLTLPTNKYPPITYIVGNPPFQNTVRYTGKTRKRILGGKNKLYTQILFRAVEMLSSRGYMTCVVPDTMFSNGSSDIYTHMITYDIQFVSFQNIRATFFPTIQHEMCYFTLCKQQPTHNTIIQNHEGTLLPIHDFIGRPINPIRNWTPHTEALIAQYIRPERNHSVYVRGQPVTAYKGNTYTVLYSPTKRLHTNNKAYAVGLGQKKAVLYMISPTLQFDMDYSGTMGSGPNTMYIPFATKKEGDTLRAFLQSNDYKDLMMSCKTNRLYLNMQCVMHMYVALKG